MLRSVTQLLLQHAQDWERCWACTGCAKNSRCDIFWHSMHAGWRRVGRVRFHNTPPEHCPHISWDSQPTHTACLNASPHTLPFFTAHRKLITNSFAYEIATAQKINTGRNISLQVTEKYIPGKEVFRTPTEESKLTQQSLGYSMPQEQKEQGTSPIKFWHQMWNKQELTTLNTRSCFHVNILSKGRVEKIKQKHMKPEQNGL